MLKFENPSNGRYYYIYTERDLFNEMVLIVLRGGRNYRTIRRCWFSNGLAVRQEIERLTKRRLARGYVLINN